jgi:hypothetical protein
MYRFTQNVHSLATGKDYRKGQIVPPDIPFIEFLEKAGSVEKVEERPSKYDAMTFDELTELLRERGLKVSGSKQEKIDRLYEDDKGGNE